MRLILARHGQTAANVAKRLSTLPPGEPLTDLGRAQADALGARLADADVTAVYASTAIRAQQTAAPVAAAHGLDVTVVDGVHELFVGELEDRADEPARELFYEIEQAWEAGDAEARLPGGESAAEVFDRFRPVVERITKGASGTVVLVSHGGAIRIVGGALTGGPTLPGYLPNTGLVVLRPAGDGWELESVDETVPQPGDVAAGGPAE
ncbi:histidine phosphatase family protein [Pseudonocardia sp. CA-107938]|uniref:histidine phosphatase family protein n=1 Tax=Pseudonocardia sp. CA-107938 TaxID=3240021 RepID=UPI003D91EAB8